MLLMFQTHHDRTTLFSSTGFAGYLDSLTSTEFVTLTRMVEGYVVDCEAICGRQSHSLRATLLSQAKKFIERFHEERRNKLGLILDNERWKQADVPAEFQRLVNSLTDGEYGIVMLDPHDLAIIMIYIEDNDEDDND
ncbi:vacuolar protein sorting-associated protein 54-like, partial [Actinia tenebrosa]|uniref:Vacuolar protein sorting-associated protein 54-like n=1 Tax=Actinia tenebrosa TaxID=6105 RepID=A0A6P8I505_ACTTE